MFTIAGFYLFAPLDDFEHLQEPLRDVCAENDVKGTVLLAAEGVNGTIAGPATGVHEVLDFLRSHEALEPLTAKFATANEDPFLRLKIRLKDEIVTLGVGDVDTVRRTATHVAPEEWNALISDPDVLVVDTRNDYEVAIGSFSGAVNPATRSFGEFPDWMRSEQSFGSATKIAMFCTGGIRCEKATAYLTEQGFEDVYQLEGGVLKYLETIPPDESLWEGECYVFDRRVSVGHGLVPGNLEICPNCNTVVGDDERQEAGYKTGVTCPNCHDTISQDRLERFSERQHQIELAQDRGERHLGARV